MPNCYNRYLQLVFQGIDIALDFILVLGLVQTGGELFDFGIEVGLGNRILCQIYHTFCK